MKIKITTDHATSSYGIPVILIDGAVADYAPALRQIRKFADLNTTDFGAVLGVSGRTVEGWEQGRMPDVRALYALKKWVEKRKN